MNNQALTTRDDFEHWLMAMDDFIEEFEAEFSGQNHQRLDFSPESLDRVEAWILKNFPDTDAMLIATESHRINCIACYVGEVFRTNRGGKWDIQFDDPNFAFHGIPIITGFRTPICPLTLATAAADRRTGNYLRTVLENAKPWGRET